MQKFAEAYQLAVSPTMSRKTIDDWHALVKQTLATQQQWSGLAGVGLPADSLPTGARTLIDQGRDLNALLLDLQDQTWTRWFDWLRSLVDNIDVEPQLEAGIESGAVPQGETVVDDFTAIDGIGPAIAAKLQAAGIDSYLQLASWRDSDIEQVENTVLGGRLKGRVRRDDWIGQAKRLSGQL